MRIVVTQGEPSGIGPEIVLRALAAFEPAPGTRVTILGDRACLDAEANRFGLPAVEGVEEVSGPCVALAALERAAELAAAGEAEAIVTAPVHKAKLHRAGFAFPGQTEFFASRLGAEAHAMMLASDDLRVVPLTTHIALRRVPGLVTSERICRRVRTMTRGLRDDFGVEDPLIAVLGLNPHSGEEGAFGDEEERAIRPAIERLVLEGHRVEGPVPADAAFAPRARGRCDAILGMYHDQVLAPFKALTSGRGVNVTLGLPVIRTSPDHGTADDIAGRGIADPSSMLAALRLAQRLAGSRFGRAEFLGGDRGGP